jgi:hypothetical protein
MRHAVRSSGEKEREPVKQRATYQCEAVEGSQRAIEIAAMRDGV